MGWGKEHTVVKTRIGVRGSQNGGLSLQWRAYERSLREKPCLLQVHVTFKIEILSVGMGSELAVSKLNVSGLGSKWTEKPWTYISCLSMCVEFKWPEGCFLHDRADSKARWPRLIVCRWCKHYRFCCRRIDTFRTRQKFIGIMLMIHI